MVQGIISVSELTKSIRLLLEGNIGLVSVEGEISNVTLHSSGHRYFTLKDRNAAISCVMWGSRSLKTQLQAGLQVVITGNISVYAPRGSYQLDVISIRPSGIGDLYVAFELLKQKLEALGYFDDVNKKEIPTMPLHIGVSTSPTGAAVQDIISTIKRRMPLATIYFRPTIVQGDASPSDIVQAIYELQQTPSQVIIIGRGGGSIEDLWAYNTEEVADAIFKCPLPIISGTGHETDFTIADFVADRRAATPTAAAELVTAINTEMIMNSIEQANSTMSQIVGQKIEEIHNSINYFNEGKAAKILFMQMRNRQQHLDISTDKLKHIVIRKYEQQNHRVAVLTSKMNEVNPLAPLERGYALLKDGEKLIKSNNSLIRHKNISILRHNEIASAEIKEVIPTN